jgi:hypothetical protein
MSYTIPRGHWCDIITLNVYNPTEDKIDDVKDSFYEEMEHVFDNFHKFLHPNSMELGTTQETTSCVATG